MKRSGYLQRKREINARSVRQVVYQAEIDEVKPLVMARCHGICEVCGAAPSTMVHHKLRRSQGGTNEMANLLGVCAGCHEFIHSQPALAYTKGWMVRRHRG